MPPALSREDRARATSAGSPALARLFRDVPIAYTMWVSAHKLRDKLAGVLPTVRQGCCCEW